MNFKWTPQRKELARLCKAEGKTRTVTANELNATLARGEGKVTSAAVSGQWNRMGLFPQQGRKSRAKGPSRGPASSLHRDIITAAGSKHKTGAPAQPAKNPPNRTSPVTKAPTRGAYSLPAIERSSMQCAMFCRDESGATGFVCGAPATRGSWCADCYRIVYTPAQGRAA